MTRLLLTMYMEVLDTQVSPTDRICSVSMDKHNLVSDKLGIPSQRNSTPSERKPIR